MESRPTTVDCFCLVATGTVKVVIQLSWSEEFLQVAGGGKHAGIRQPMILVF
jgi:hypothetical protein